MSNGKRIRMGISGLGAFGRVIATAAKGCKEAELVTCFDPKAENRAKYATQFGIEQETSYEAMVKRADLDAVLLVVPNVLHAPQTVLAAEHGKHVYVIKPIANTIDDAKRMTAACDQAGVTFMVGHPRRRQSASRKAKALVAQGALGKLIQVEANASSWQGFELTPDQFRWRGDDTGCPGGSLMTIGVHDIDMFNYIFGPIKTVFSLFNRLYIPADVDDVTSTVCQFESGILGYLGSNFASPRTDWMYIYGTDANLLWTVPPFDLPFEERAKSNAAKPQTRLLIYEKGKGEREIPLEPNDPHADEVDEFCRCIRTGARPETGGLEGLAALAFVRAAIESARTKQLIALNY